MKSDISIIIPFFNENDNLVKLVEELNKYISTLKGLSIQILFVDDGSTDNSFKTISKLKHKYYFAKIIKLSRNFGSHAALRAGVLHADGRFITFMPADRQNPIDLNLRLYHKAKEGYDIVWAERGKVEIGLIEKIFSRLYAQLMRKFVISNFPEKGFDIVMFNQRVRDELNRNIEANSSLFLQIQMMGFKQSVISYHKQTRAIGKSKWTVAKKVKLFIDSFVAFSYAPIRLVSIMGILFSAAGFLWMIYVAARTLLYHNLAPGWPALLAILMIGFGITNISLGIIAEYLWRTLDATRNRSVFIVDEIIDLKGQHG